jgi:hypothetical protein
VRRGSALFVLLGLVLCASFARADSGAWLWIETRVPIVGRAPTLPRLSWRILSDTRLTVNSGGLFQQYLRTGPVFDVTKWLVLAVHGTIYADRRPDGSFEQEARLEVEPTFQLNVAGFRIADRSRLEFRWRPAHSRLRYRNQLRVAYWPEGWPAFPVVWNEFLIDATDGYSENRFVAGVGIPWAKGRYRVELAYMLRSRRAGDVWTHDHFALPYFYIGF